MLIFLFIQETNKRRIGIKYLTQNTRMFVYSRITQDVVFAKEKRICS